MASIALQRALRPFLWPAGMLNSLYMRIRRNAYDKQLLLSWRAPVPVVSIGNIGWGGAGKTPLCSWVLGWAERRGVRACVLTRGYRARPGSLPYLVKPDSLAEEAGDEPLMLAREHVRSAVVVDPVRRRGGRWALEKIRPQFFVLDDGFQHMGVRRDLNLVLLKPSDLTTDWDAVIPAGSWREGRTALPHADAFLIKCPPEEFAGLESVIRQRLEWMGKPVFNMYMQPMGVRQVNGAAGGAELGGEPYMLVSGVGDPAQVERTAEDYFGYRPSTHLTFRDHHLYTKNDVVNISQVARRRGAMHVVCTPKDAVKIGPMADDNFWTFDLTLKFGATAFGHEPFDKWWSARFNLWAQEHAAKAAREQEDHEREAQEDEDATP